MPDSVNAFRQKGGAARDEAKRKAKVSQGGLVIKSKLILLMARQANTLRAGLLGKE